MAQAAHDPKQKLALATQGLAVFKPVTQLIQEAEQLAADAAAVLAQTKAGIQGVSCSTDMLDSAQQAADAAAATAHALDDPTSNGQKIGIAREVDVRQDRALPENGTAATRG